MSYIDWKYIDAADVAKMIRKGLKESFPGVKFAVKTDKYAGGASINIRWENGPSSDMVDALTRQYKSDGGGRMDDSRKRNYQLLDGKPVSFGSDFVMVKRDLTEDVSQKLLNEAAAALQIPAPTSGVWTRKEIEALPYEQENALYREFRKRESAYSEFEKPLPSAEFGRVFLIGNDDDNADAIEHAKREYLRRQTANETASAVTTRPRQRKPGM